MSLVKGAMLLLLLAVIGINAAPGPEDCDGLNKTLSAPDLHKVYGDWALVWAVTDSNFTVGMIGNLSSSLAQINLLPDNRTIAYQERMLSPVGFGEMRMCVKTSFNVSMPADPDQHGLHVGNATVDINGGVVQYDAASELYFYESCPDCLVMEYRTKTVGRILVIYRRKDSPMDPELLKAAHSDYEKLAKCLGFPHDKPYIFNGQSDYCQTGQILSMGDDALEYQPASM